MLLVFENYKKAEIFHPKSRNEEPMEKAVFTVEKRYLPWVSETTPELFGQINCITPRQSANHGLAETSSNRSQ